MPRYRIEYLVACVLIAVPRLVLAQMDVRDNEHEEPPPGQSAIDFGAFDFNEEEMTSEVLTDELRCDGCNAVLNQIHIALEKQKLKPKEDFGDDKNGRREQAIKIATALESGCDPAIFDAYGVKQVNGVKYLEGPGLPARQAGLVQGGQKWPKRLTARCKAIVEDVGEEILVERFFAGTDSFAQLCADDCEGRKMQPLREDDDEDDKTGAIKKTSKKQRGEGLEELPAPPYVHKELTDGNIQQFVKGKKGKLKKFRVVLFHNASKMSTEAVALFEHAARILRKDKKPEVRNIEFGRYYVAEGLSAWQYELEYLPQLLMFRPGYKNAKEYGGKNKVPEDVVNYLRHEVLNVYKKDDESKYPRINGRTKVRPPEEEQELNPRTSDL